MNTIEIIKDKGEGYYTVKCTINGQEYVQEVIMPEIGKELEERLQAYLEEYAAGLPTNEQ